VAGKEGYLPAMFGRHNKRLKTPLNAMCLQAALTITLIVVGGGFRSLVNFAVVGKFISYCTSDGTSELTSYHLDSFMGILLPHGSLNIAIFSHGSN
jgi:uncharacterized membrane protein SpoIIM required for sporulation